MTHGTREPDPVARQAEAILARQFIEEGITEDRDVVVARPKPFPEGLRDTDTDNAERFVHLHGDRIRYVPKWKKWVVWNGFSWMRDHDEVLVTELAKDVSRRLFGELASPGFVPPGGKNLREWSLFVTRSASGPGLRHMTKLARGIKGVVTDPSEFDADFWALGVGNGWIDLRDGSFHESDASKLMTMHTKIRWNPDAEAPLWERVLSEWLPDLETRHYFQRIIGMAAVGQIRDHVIVLLYGGGGNGKGTAVRALSKVFGPYYTVPNKSLIVVTKRDSIDEGKSKLFRKRFVIAPETDTGEHLNEAQVKELTGGDDIDARGLYKDSFTFSPTHTLFLHTNHLPNIGDMGTGMWRRIRVIPWPTKFKKGIDEDRELDEKLEPEFEGILKWVVQGAVAWGKEGVDEPQAVLDATSQYRTSQDVIEQFFEATGITPGKGLTATGREVTAAWQQWVGPESGIPRSGQHLKKLLEAHGYKHKPGRPARWIGFSVPEEATRGAPPF